MILGIEQTVSQLSVGAKATAHVPSGLAYGRMGHQPHIMDNEDVTVTIEVLSAGPADSSTRIMTFDQKLQKAEENKERAKQLFKD